MVQVAQRGASEVGGSRLNCRPDTLQARSTQRLANLPVRMAATTARRIESWAVRKGYGEDQEGV